MASALVFLPLGASAEIVFTEIMYDAPASDTGHEWVEIQNVGSAAVDLKGWRLSEGGVNHKLTFASNSIIPAGAYAVIADDVQKFLSDQSAFSGIIFDSSFSLGNTGETIGLSDASSTPVAFATYSSFAGATGDGNSLNLVSGAWVPRSSSPGASVSASAIVPPPKAVPTPKTAGNSKSAKAVSTKSDAGSSGETSREAGPALAAAASAGSPGSASSILPWIFGLLAVIMAGIGVIFMMPKRKPADEYEITEEKS
ncbi:MAG: lamin tail domain-containing protein [bacterium]|nr:lamin tail domain-containing protein [bacterium]